MLLHAEITFFEDTTFVNYVFDASSHKLIRIDSISDDSSISLEYEGNNATWPVRLVHTNGKKLRVTYNNAGMISYVDLLNEDDRVIKTRC